MCAMARIYRVARGGEIFYASEDNGGGLRRISTRGDDPFSGYEPGGAVKGGLGAVQVLTPLLPRKIVCVGLNYKDHAAEVGKKLPPEPLLFFKPSTAVIGPGAAIKLPPGVGRVDYEAELALVIGRRAHRVSAARAWDYVFGMTCLNDVTARDMQNKEPQYTRCKSFDTFAPIGPCIATGLDGAPRRVEAFVNGARRQSSSTAELIFPLEHLVEYVTFVMTLEPGDIISTGTPPGIGPLKAGDEVVVKVEGIGDLKNPVEDE
jgi:2-keto-4-pentenoate hydratase/2-oxohepta-3-ene-1,7-dioic acid hydratase in catechol pathway